MAASVAAMQSILAATPLKGAAAVDNRISPHCYTAPPFLRRSTARNVRCSAEGGPNESNKEFRAPNPPAASSSTPPPPPPKPKPSTNFSDLLAFGGPAPEVINGRLAMVGFVAAIAVEAASGEGLLSQVSDGGAVWFLGTSVLLSVASLVPLLKGVSVQSKSEGLMSSDAEMWNGRFAMLGLVALALTEFLKGGALV